MKMKLHIDGLFPKEAMVDFQGKRGWFLYGDFFPEETVREMLRDFQPVDVDIEHKSSSCSMSVKEI